MINTWKCLANKIGVDEYLINYSYNFILKNTSSSIANLICFFIVFYQAKSNYLYYTAVLTSISIFFAICSVLFSGASINISKAFGKNNNKVDFFYKRYSTIIFFQSIFFGLILLFISCFFANFLYHELNSLKLINLHYIMSFSVFFICISSSLTMLIQTQGDYKALTKITFFYNIVKISIVCFIAAAFQNDVVFYIFCSFVLLDFLFCFLIFNICFRQNILTKDIFRAKTEFLCTLKSYKFSLPICFALAGQRYLYAYLMIYAVLVGEEQSKIFGIIFNLLSVALVIFSSNSHAGALLNGRAIGNNNIDRSKLLFKSTLILSFLISIFLSVFIILFMGEAISGESKLLFLLYLVTASSISVIISFMRSDGVIYIPQTFNTLIPISVSFLLLDFCFESKEIDNLFICLFVSSAFNLFIQVLIYKRYTRRRDAKYN